VVGVQSGFIKIKSKRFYERLKGDHKEIVCFTCF
jgi:hypothetical protein